MNDCTRRQWWNICWYWTRCWLAQVKYDLDHFKALLLKNLLSTTLQKYLFINLMNLFYLTSYVSSPNGAWGRWWTFSANNGNNGSFCKGVALFQATFLATTFTCLHPIDWVVCWLPVGLAYTAVGYHNSGSPVRSGSGQVGPCQAGSDCVGPDWTRLGRSDCLCLFQ